MRVDWLEDVVALLRAGGVTEAARLRNITQPAFSRRIKTLEDALAIDLIDRSIKPSGPSKALREHEKEFLRLAAEQRQLMAEIRTEQESGAQTLSIACQHAISTSLGPKVVGHLTEADRLHIRLRSANLDECEALLTGGQVAMTLTYRVSTAELSEGEVPPHLLRAELGEDRLIPVCDPPSCDRHLHNLADGQVRIIGYPANVFLGETMAAFVYPALRRDHRVQVVTEVGLTPAALHLAQAGLGLAWIPRSLAQPSLDRGDLMDLSAHYPSVPLRILAHRSRTTQRRSCLQAWDKLLELRAA